MTLPHAGARSFVGGSLKDIVNRQLAPGEQPLHPPAVSTDVPPQDGPHSWAPSPGPETGSPEQPCRQAGLRSLNVPSPAHPSLHSFIHSSVLPSFLPSVHHFMFPRSPSVSHPGPARGMSGRTGIVSCVEVSSLGGTDIMSPVTAECHKHSNGEMHGGWWPGRPAASGIRRGGRVGVGSLPFCAPLAGGTEDLCFLMRAPAAHSSLPAGRTCTPMLSPESPAFSVLLCRGGGQAPGPVCWQGVRRQPAPTRGPLPAGSVQTAFSPVGSCLAATL